MREPNLSGTQESRAVAVMLELTEIHFRNVSVHLMLQTGEPNIEIHKVQMESRGSLAAADVWR